jgi:asparagine synthase (glutamine-hydrolysing)
MAVSLEVRSPLLDIDLLGFAWSLPDEFVVDQHSGKRILKDLLARSLPRELFERPKRGFSVPTAEWLRGPAKDWAEALPTPDIGGTRRRLPNRRTIATLSLRW